MANSKKRISELPALSVASLDTTFVLGISGSTTYKISINNLTSSLDTTFATDLVTATLSSSLDGKLSTSSFNSYTSSFTASVASGTISGSSQLTSSFDTRYVVSGSITQTTWDNIANKPSGIVSQSTDLSSLNTFTASISTASLVNRLNAIESVSGSWITESETGSFLTSLSGAISSSTQISDLGFVTGSYTTINSFNSLTQSFNSISQSFTTISGSVGTIDFGGINSVTASYLAFTQSFNTYTASISTASLVTSIDNLNIFTASQSTSSLVNRLNAIENVSGSWITESETGSFLTSLNGAISSSAQITTLGFVSGSYETTGRGIISSSANLVTTSSYNADSASFDTRINSIATESGSNLTYFIEAYANVTYTLPGGFTEDICRYSVVSDTENVPSNWFNTSTYRFTPQKAGYWEINAAYDVYRNTEASMAIRKNGSIVASAGSFNAVAQDISKTVYLNGSTDYIDIVNTGGAALQRAQFDSRSWFQAKFVGVVSGSTDLLSANNTFTGTNVFSGSTTLRGAVTIGTGSGVEGGEINLAYAQTTSLTGSALNFDVYQDRLRIFEGGGNNRGAYLNVASQSNSVGSEILTTTSTNILATPAWTSAGAITLTATTTNPTKGVTAQDNISYRQLGAKEWEIVMTYNQSANTGYVQGSGDYLITLPNGLSFDTTLPSQTIYTSNVGTTTWAHNAFIIPNGNGLITNTAVGGHIYPMVYSATKFRILTITYGSGILCWGSGFYSTIDTPKIQLSFRFTST